MEIKCPKCKSSPKIDIFDNIQAIRFICKDTNNNHYGLLSINNFYKYFITNYNDKFNNFINESYKKYEKNTENQLSSIFQFIKFIKDFDILLKEINNEFENLKKYFFKILFIKDIIENKSDNKKEYSEIENYYYNDHIIKGMKELINIIKNTILIKEEYPKIKNSKEISSQIDTQLKLLNKNILNLNIINKDFEYYNYNQNNCNIKKLIKFELKSDNDINTIRDRKLFKLNTTLHPGCFIYSYTKRNNGLNDSYISIYDTNLNILLTKFIYSQRIKEIIQLKNNSILLIFSKLILLITIDLNNKSIDIIQTFEKKTRFYFEILLDNNKVSLLIPTNTKRHFYLKNNIINDNYNKYTDQIVSISTPVSNENIYLINKNNFINTNIRQILFYHVNYNYNEIKKCYEIEIINDSTLQAKDLLNYGIHFINKDTFVLSGLNYLYLISVPYKEIISIFSYYNNDRLYNGYNNECYILLNAWVSHHKIIRQINFNENNNYKNNEKGELIVDGQTFLENLDFYNRYCLIDLEDKICYIKVNQKEDDEIEYGTQYNRD